MPSKKGGMIKTVVGVVSSIDVADQGFAGDGKLDDGGSETAKEWFVQRM